MFISLQARLPTYLILILLVVPILSRAVSAADVSLIERGSGSPAWIRVQGEIEPGDVAKFMAIAAPHADAVILLGDSPGGQVEAATTLGRIIRARKYTTAVEGKCTSACALVWLAGTSMRMGPEAKIGFHAASRGRDDTDERRLSAPGNAIVGAYMKELGFSDEFIRFAVSAPIDGMKHLTDNDIRQHGLAVSKIDGVSREREQQAYAWHNEAVSKRWKKPADYAEAVRLYKLAAEANYAGSQNNLGDLYETGTGLPKAPGLAIYWYTRAAERGEPTAYLSLSSYLPEISQDKDTLIQAAKFAILATRGLDEGHNKATAESNRRSLEKRLSSEEYAQARVLADRWQPLFQETHLMSDRPAPAD